MQTFISICQRLHKPFAVFITFGLVLVFGNNSLFDELFMASEFSSDRIYKVVLAVQECLHYSSLKRSHIRHELKIEFRLLTVLLENVEIAYKTIKRGPISVLT